MTRLDLDSVIKVILGPLGIAIGFTFLLIGFFAFGISWNYIASPYELPVSLETVLRALVLVIIIPIAGWVLIKASLKGMKLDRWTKTGAIIGAIWGAICGLVTILSMVGENFYSVAYESRQSFFRWIIFLPSMLSFYLFDYRPVFGFKLGLFSIIISILIGMIIVCGIAIMIRNFFEKGKPDDAWIKTGAVIGAIWGVLSEVYTYGSTNYGSVSGYWNVFENRIALSQWMYSFPGMLSTYLFDYRPVFGFKLDPFSILMISILIGMIIVCGIAIIIRKFYLYLYEKGKPDDEFPDDEVLEEKY